MKGAEDGGEIEGQRKMGMVAVTDSYLPNE